MSYGYAGEAVNPVSVHLYPNRPCEAHAMGYAKWRAVAIIGKQGRYASLLCLPMIATLSLAKT